MISPNDLPYIRCDICGFVILMRGSNECENGCRQPYAMNRKERRRNAAQERKKK